LCPPGIFILFLFLFLLLVLAIVTEGILLLLLVVRRWLARASRRAVLSHQCHHPDGFPSLSEYYFWSYLY
jgi:hypothetical protein